MTSPLQKPVFRLTRGLIVLWLAVLSIAEILDHTHLQHGREKDLNAAHRAGTALESRLSKVEQALQSIRSAPPALSEARFSAANDALKRRLARLEQSMGGTVARADLVPLEERLSTEEERIGQIQSAMRRHPTRAMPAKRIEAPVPGLPPFTPIAPELRGGERFLSILLADGHALTAVHLLRVGEAEDGWTLVAIDGNTARFRVQGQIVGIALP